MFAITDVISTVDYVRTAGDRDHRFAHQGIPRNARALPHNLADNESICAAIEYTRPSFPEQALTVWAHMLAIRNLTYQEPHALPHLSDIWVRCHLLRSPGLPGTCVVLLIQPIRQVAGVCARPSDLPTRSLLGAADPCWAARRSSRFPAETARTWSIGYGDAATRSGSPLGSRLAGQPQ